MGRSPQNSIHNGMVALVDNLHSTILGQKHSPRSARIIPVPASRVKRAGNCTVRTDLEYVIYFVIIYQMFCIIYTLLSCKQFVRLYVVYRVGSYHMATLGHQVPKNLNRFGSKSSIVDILHRLSIVRSAFSDSFAVLS